MAGSVEQVGVKPLRLVFIHGFMDESSFWDGVVENIQTVPRARMAAVNLPGMGNRAGDDGDFDLLRLTEFVRSEIIASNDAQVVIVGHSMGAQVAELVACSMPDDVSGLVLIAPVPLGGLPLPDDMVAAMRLLSRDPVAQRQMRSGLLHDPASRHLDAMVAAGQKVSPHVADALLDAWRNGLPVGERPTDCNGPVCIIGGESDRFSTPELLQKQILPRFERADFILAKNAGHWPHLERPVSVAAAIDRFVTQLVP